MKIEIEPKEIAELVELLTRRNPAEWKEDINKLGEFGAKNFNHLQDWFVVMEKWFRYLDGKLIGVSNMNSSVAPLGGQTSKTF